ncbi:MAG: heavy metal-associated domain-containing protein [Candidatus Micrarchaeota archaeon]
MPITAKRFIVLGIDCGSCATTIEKALRKMDGVKRADLNYNTARLEVEFEGGKEAEKRIISRVRVLGYKIA